MSSVASQNYTLPDPCQSAFEFFTDEFLAPYNATYTFCQEAANKCVDGTLGAANVSSATVTDVRNSSTTTATRPLYYFYSQSYSGSEGDHRLPSCLTQNQLANVSVFWAPGQQIRDAARIAKDSSSLGNAAPHSSRRPQRSSSSLSQLLTLALAFIFVFQHLVGTAYASSLPASSSLQKRAIGCTKFEVQGTANQTGLASNRLSEVQDCVHLQRCVVQAYGQKLSADGKLTYKLDVQGGPSIDFDEEELIKNSFDATLIERYSPANRQRASTPLVVIQSDSSAKQYLSASKSADLYSGAFTQCQDGNTYPAHLFIANGKWLYNYVSSDV